MFLQLLENEVTFISIPESLLYALIGFAVTFLGIVILIFFVWLAGKLMGLAVDWKNEKKRTEVSEQETELSQVAKDEISEEVKVAIIAALAAYYEGENSSCEFKVKRIRRL